MGLLLSGEMSPERGGRYAVLADPVGQGHRAKAIFSTRLYTNASGEIRVSSAFTWPKKNDLPLTYPANQIRPDRSQFADRLGAVISPE